MSMLARLRSRVLTTAPRRPNLTRSCARPRISSHASRHSDVSVYYPHGAPSRPLPTSRELFPSQPTATSTLIAEHTPAAATGGGEVCRTIDDFLERAKKGTATVGDARTCVQHTRASLDHLPLSERRQRCISLRAGGRILHWLWEHHPRSNDSIYSIREVMHTLCWYLLPERLE